MKRIIVLVNIFVTVSVAAQFNVSIEVPADFTPKEVYLYSLNGSKDILNSRETRKGNSWQIKVSKPYTGMMKLYFPEEKISLNFI